MTDIRGHTKIEINGKQYPAVMNLGVLGDLEADDEAQFEKLLNGERPKIAFMTLAFRLALQEGDPDLADDEARGLARNCGFAQLAGLIQAAFPDAPEEAPSGNGPRPKRKA